MAHFIGRIQGRSGATSRLGDKRTGIHATLSGWNFGLYVELSHEDEPGSGFSHRESGRDVVRIYQTKGSNGGGEKALVLTLREGGAFSCHDSGDDQPTMP